MAKKISLLLLAILALSSIAFCYKKYRCYDKLIHIVFEKRFTEPVEVLYLLMSDMRLYKLTSYEDFRVSFNFYELKKRLKKDDYKISDIIVIIHNHKTDRDFSKSDIHTWQMFKQEGFTGNFYIYVEMNKTIYELREE